MIMYWELYKKEIRQHGQEYLVLSLFMILSSITVVFNNPQVFWNTLARLSWNYPKTSASFELIQMLATYLLFFFAPAILVYSLYDERKTRAHTQGISLPLPRYMILLNKCLSILSVALLLDIIQTSVWHNFSTKSVLGIPGDVMELFLEQVSILGIAVAAIGLSQVFRRNRALVGILSAFILLLTSRFFVPHTTRFMYTGIPDDLSMKSFVLLRFLIRFICTASTAGLLFLIGLTLYHKRAEV